MARNPHAQWHWVLSACWCVVQVNGWLRGLPELITLCRAIREGITFPGDGEGAVGWPYGPCLPLRRAEARALM